MIIPNPKINKKQAKKELKEKSHKYDFGQWLSDSYLKSQYSADAQKLIEQTKEKHHEPLQKHQVNSFTHFNSF